MSFLLSIRSSLPILNKNKRTQCLYIRRLSPTFHFSTSSTLFRDLPKDLDPLKQSITPPNTTTTKPYNSRRTWSHQDTEKLLKLIAKYGNKWKVFTSYFPGRTSFCIRSHYLSVTHDTTRWTLEEKKILQQRLGKQEDPEKIDWEAIQAALPKKRTVARIKQFYQNSIQPTLNKGIWNKEETQQLMNLVELHGSKDWEKISTIIGTRSEEQCRNKWVYENNTLKKGEFSKEEDVALAAALKKYGPEQFQQIKEEMNSKRSISQLRSRYNNCLNPDVDRSPWSDEEKRIARELFAELQNIRAVKAKMNSKRSIRDLYNHLRSPK